MGAVTLCAPRRVGKNRHSACLSIRPRLLYQAKSPLVADNEILWHLVWGPTAYQIAAKQGRADYKDSAKVARNQPIAQFRRLMQRVVACAEEKRLTRVTLGGVERRARWTPQSWVAIGKTP